jgi:hypothetical protein
VETQADGYGPIVPTQTIGTGSSITAYAIARSEPNNFVENVAVDSWSLVNKTGGVVDGDLVPAADMKSAVFTGHSLGSAQVHAVKAGLSSIDSGTITVGPGALDHFDISAVPSPQTANAAFSITITAKDASGNTVTGYGGSNALTADAGTVNRYGVPINPSATGAFVNGVWSGTVAIGATCKAAQIHTTGGGKSGQSNGFDVGSYWLTFTVQPTDIAAGSTIIVMVLVADPSDGSPILGAQVTLTMGNNPGGVTLNVSVVANANGYARIPFSINVPGNGYTVIASYTIPGFGTVSRESNPFNIY